jgi:hypothetical protein
MAFGASKFELIDGSGESTSVTDVGGFTFPVPFDGEIFNLQVSADLRTGSTVTSLNTVGIEYDYSVYKSPSVPNNGIDHAATNYTTTSLTSFVVFGYPNNTLTANSFRSASNINTGTINVSAGDRIGVRIRTKASTDASASNVSQVTFSASISYAPTLT